jgi:hypothetical protein
MAPEFLMLPKRSNEWQTSNQRATGARHRRQRRPSALLSLYNTALLNLVKSRGPRLGFRYIVAEDEKGGVQKIKQYR